MFFIALVFCRACKLTHKFSKQRHQSQLSCFTSSIGKSGFLNSSQAEWFMDENQRPNESGKFDRGQTLNMIFALSACKGIAKMKKL